MSDLGLDTFSLIPVLMTFIKDIILSLVRTTRVGYLRDIRRLTVALSRARLGLYIIGRREVFETCYELRQAFKNLFRRPDKLMLTTGEMFPTARLLENEAEGTEMAGVEHLGQYVYEMTNAKLESLKAGRAQLPAIEETPEAMRIDVEDDGDGDGKGAMEGVTFEEDEQGEPEKPDEAV